MGEGRKGRLMSSSAEQDKRTEMACMYSGSSPPKTQRISLMMERQAKFVSEKKISGKMPDLNDDTKNSSRPPPTNLVGSNTSLSSGSSNRSYADSVRAGLSHHSVEDLSLNLSK